MIETSSIDVQVHPYTYILSLYGGYVLPRGGEIWVGSLIKALGTLGFSEGAVRTLVSRMRRKELLLSRRQGRRSFYRLSDGGRKEVSWGDKQAFSPPTQAWDTHWTVVIYSFPEKRRKQRDELRRSLKWWKFGTLVPGTWISPHPLLSEAEEKWRKLDLWPYLEIFRADHLGPSDPRALATRVWPQIPELSAHYHAYVAQYEPMLRHIEAGLLGDRECFALQLQSLCEIVAITLEDPALPAALLPEEWPRPTAQSCFKQLQHALVEPAARFFDTIYEKGE